MKGPSLENRDKRDKQDRYENVISCSVNFSVSFIEKAFKNTLPEKNQK